MSQALFSDMRTCFRRVAEGGIKFKPQQNSNVREDIWENTSGGLSMKSWSRIPTRVSVSRSFH
jgi:hypothetical protein